MAQNDVIKEIIFIADEQHEAPRTAWPVALAYLVALALAEVLVSFISPLWGMILYGLILLALLVHSSAGSRRQLNHFLLVLAIVPLTRLLAMTLPLGYIDRIYWDLLLGVLLSVAVLITIRLTGLNNSEIGLRIDRQGLPLQLLVGMSGLGIGIIEYLILRPEPYISRFSWGLFLLSALMLLAFAGLLQEVIWRGLLQTSLVQLVGGPGILYVALLFALGRLGYGSLLDMGFLFLAGLAFGLVASRTRSLVGVSISHGLANVSLLLIIPLLVESTAARNGPPLVIADPLISTPTRTLEISPTQTQELSATRHLVLIPVTGPSATPIPATQTPPACESHPNWVVYVVQAGETLETISTLYRTSSEVLLAANCLEVGYQVEIGQGLFVPFDLLPNLTPSPQVKYTLLSTPTSTATKKPVRKPPATPTSSPQPEAPPLPPTPAPTFLPPTSTPQELPTLAPTQGPSPTPPPTTTPET